MSCQKWLEGEEMVPTGGEKPRGGKTGGESSSSRALSLPLVFKSLEKVSVEV